MQFDIDISKMLLGERAICVSFDAMFGFGMLTVYKLKELKRYKNDVEVDCAIARPIHGLPG